MISSHLEYSLQDTSRLAISIYKQPKIAYNVIKISQAMDSTFFRHFGGQPFPEYIIPLFILFRMGQKKGALKKDSQNWA